MKIEFRPMRISDAKRFVEILSNSAFVYFPAKPCSIKQEKDFIRQCIISRKQGTQHNFTILHKGNVIGAIGTRLDTFSKNICNIGYFVDRRYWSKGIATKALGMLEDFILENLDVSRLVAVMAKDNKASEKVAKKLSYKKEGLMRKYLQVGEKWHDCYLYAKII